MSSRASSLQEYCSNLRCIKAKNVPSIAARMARTLTLLPTDFNSRKVKIENTTVDRTGQYFDTIWDELVGANIALIQGITLSDAKYVLDRLEDLSRSVVRFGTYYSGRIQTASSEFTQDLTRIGDGGEFYSRISEISSSIGSTSGLTYNELGYSIDQATLKDVSLERNYDLYEFLRDVSRKDIFTWVYTIQNFITCVDVKNVARYNSIKTYAGILLGLVTDVVKIILDLEHKLDDIRPIKKTSNSVSEFDVISPENISDLDVTSWSMPSAAQPLTRSHEFYLSATGRYRVAFVTKTPCYLETLTLNDEKVSFVYLRESGSDHVYVSDAFECTLSDVISYHIGLIPGNSEGFSSDKVSVYLIKVDSYQRQTTVVPGKSGYFRDGNKLCAYPVSTTQRIQLVINSNVDITATPEFPTGAKLGNQNVDVVPLLTDHPLYLASYRYHYAVINDSTYADRDTPVEVLFESAISTKNSNYAWYSSDDISIYITDIGSDIATDVFDSSWQDVTQFVKNRVAQISSSTFESTTIQIPKSSLDDNGESGQYQLAAVVTSPIGSGSFSNDENYVFTLAIPWIKEITGETMNSSASVDESTLETYPLNVKSFKTSVADVGEFDSLSISLGTKSGSTIKVSDLEQAFARGMHVLVKRVGENADLFPVVYRSVWPNVVSISTPYNIPSSWWHGYYSNSTRSFTTDNAGRVSDIKMLSTDVSGASGLCTSRMIAVSRCAIVQSGGIPSTTPPIITIIKKIGDTDMYHKCDYTISPDALYGAEGQVFENSVLDENGDPVVGSYTVIGVKCVDPMHQHLYVRSGYYVVWATDFIPALGAEACGIHVRSNVYSQRWITYVYPWRFGIDSSSTVASPTSMQAIVSPCKNTELNTVRFQASNTSPHLFEVKTPGIYLIQLEPIGDVWKAATQERLLSTWTQSDGKVINTYEYNYTQGVTGDSIEHQVCICAYKYRISGNPAKPSKFEDARTSSYWRRLFERYATGPNTYVGTNDNYSVDWTTIPLAGHTGICRVMDLSGKVPDTTTDFKWLLFGGYKVGGVYYPVNWSVTYLGQSY